MIPDQRRFMAESEWPFCFLCSFLAFLPFFLFTAMVSPSCQIESRSSRIKLAAKNHLFAQPACLAKLGRLLIVGFAAGLRAFLLQSLQLLIKKLVDQGRRVTNCLPVFVQDFHSIRMLHALRNH